MHCVHSTLRKEMFLMIVQKQQQYVMVKGKSKGLDTCYSAAYMSHTRDRQRFTI